MKRTFVESFDRLDRLASIQRSVRLPRIVLAIARHARSIFGA
jgi:hypothetical protein